MSVYESARHARETLHKLPLVTCAPWCEDGDGHPREDYIENQDCMSRELVVPLTRMHMLLGDPSEPDKPDARLRLGAQTSRSGPYTSSRPFTWAATRSRA
jgi:hypothetical protein